MSNDTLQTARGGGFYEEPGERGPLTFLELLDAYKAFRMAANGVVEKPHGISQAKWQHACEVADESLSPLSWVMGHGGGPTARLLDMIVRAAGPLTGGLPDPGPESWPLMYHALQVPPGACPHCAAFHHPQMPHECGSRYYQARFFGRYARRPTLADAMAHCAEPVQRAFMAVWTGAGAWPVIPPGWVPPDDLGNRIRAAFASARRFIK